MVELNSALAAELGIDPDTIGVTGAVLSADGRTAIIGPEFTVGGMAEEGVNPYVVVLIGDRWYVVIDGLLADFADL